MYVSFCHFVQRTVPMDLDVKMKATMLAACFLIVSLPYDIVLPLALFPG